MVVVINVIMNLDLLKKKFVLEKWNYMFFLIASQYVIKLKESNPFFQLVTISIENWSLKPIFKRKNGPPSPFLRWSGAGSPMVEFF